MNCSDFFWHTVFSNEHFNTICENELCDLMMHEFLLWLLMMPTLYVEERFLVISQVLNQFSLIVFFVTRSKHIQLTRKWSSPTRLLQIILNFRSIWHNRTKKLYCRVSYLNPQENIKLRSEFSVCYHSPVTFKQSPYHRYLNMVLISFPSIIVFWSLESFGLITVLGR